MCAAGTLGAYLRQYRERAGLSADEVSAGSRIVPRLVDALEADQRDVLPAPVYVRGFVRAYCEQVGADVEEALRLYDLQAAPPPSVAIQEPAPPRRPALAVPAQPWARVVAGSVVIACLGVVAILLLGRRHPDVLASRGAGAATAARSSTELVAPEATAAPAAPVAPSPVALPGAPASPLPSAAPATTTLAAPTASAPRPIERVLLMRATDTTWVRVQAEGGKPTEETLSPGAVREWRTAGRFRVTLGNAGGVELTLDGQALPVLGALGQVVRDVIIPGETRP